MKAATGELNMTVIIVIAIAIMAAFFYTVIWPRLRDNQNAIINCRQAICGTDVDGNGMVGCTFRGTTLRCTWKG